MISVDKQQVLVIALIVLAMSGVIALNLRPAATITSGDPTNQRAVLLEQRLYTTHCAGGHGQHLEGEPGWEATLAAGGRPAPPHAATGHTWHHPDLSLFTIVKFDGQSLESCARNLGCNTVIDTRQHIE